MKNKKQAFTILEVVLAVAIFSIAIIPIMMLYPAAVKNTVKADKIEESSRIALAVADYIKSPGYKKLVEVLRGPSATSTDTMQFKFDLVPATAGAPMTKESTYTYGVGLDGDRNLNPLVPKDLFLLNSKAINLSQVRISGKLKLEKVKLISSSAAIGAPGSYKSAVSLDEINNDIYAFNDKLNNQLIVVEINVEDTSNVLKFNNYKLTFPITPIDEWRK